MAPKSTRNIGDKVEGAKTMRAGNDKGDAAGAVRRPTTVMAKSSGKNMTGTGREDKNGDGVMPPLSGLGSLLGGEAIGNIGDTTSVLSKEALKHVEPNLAVGDKETVKSIKPPEWAKDGSDKFDSLTEESDFTSSEHTLSESGSSISPETGSISSSNEPIVWQQRRHRKRATARSGPSEGTELFPLSGTKTLKWDYSGIGLTDYPLQMVSI
ncbi:hypothetical protein NDU88_005806 [Pleurodeles waltl]|uniref:Uncharacterized protein n=1 Tax=Pleurodeles waltl TaxID=8319 RepID=A0AAV7LMG6_PLEWA|nr:hypothetical protein NDU88_005806 [Pleurodeles waltl]